MYQQLINWQTVLQNHSITTNSVALYTKLGLTELPSRLRGDIKDKEESAVPRCTTMYSQLSRRLQVTNILKLLKFC